MIILHIRATNIRNWKKTISVSTMNENQNHTMEAVSCETVDSARSNQHNLAIYVSNRTIQFVESFTQNWMRWDKVIEFLVERWLTWEDSICLRIELIFLLMCVHTQAQLIIAFPRSTFPKWLTWPERWISMSESEHELCKRMHNCCGLY